MKNVFFIIILLIITDFSQAQLFLRPSYNSKERIYGKNIVLLKIQDSIIGEYEQMIYEKYPNYLAKYSSNKFSYSDVDLKDKYAVRQFTIQRPQKTDTTRVFFPKKGEIIDLGERKADFIILLCGIDIYLKVIRDNMFLSYYYANFNTNCIIWDNVKGDFVAQGVISSKISLKLRDKMELADFDLLLAESAKEFFKKTRFSNQ